MQKLSIKECNYLLLNKSVENKKVFLKGFIPCIQKIANFLSDKYHHSLTGSYDYEDLVNDGFLLAADLYDSFIPNRTDIAYEIFKMFYAKSMKNLLKNTFLLNASPGTTDKIDNIEKVKEKYYEENGVLPDYRTLLKIAGYKRIIDRPIIRVNFDDANLGSYEIEEEILKKVLIEKIRDSFREKLKVYSERDRTLILLYYGYLDGKKYTYDEVGKIFNISRQRACKICREIALEYFYNPDIDAKQYAKEL